MSGIIGRVGSKSGVIGTTDLHIGSSSDANSSLVLEDNNTKWSIKSDNNLYGYAGSDLRFESYSGNGTFWIDGVCSAADMVDRTPYPETLQLAYDVINSHKKLPANEYKADDVKKQLDHANLHEYVSMTTPATLYTENDDLPEGVSVGDVRKEEEKSRNMSGVVSCLVEVIKDLSAKVTELENA